MVIGGLEKLTLIDYPEHLAAIIFTQSCNFRCHFCYNPLLVWPRMGSDGKNSECLSQSSLTEQSVLRAESGAVQAEEKGFSPLKLEDLFLFLRSKIGRLEAVVITGGEPTLHYDLPDFIRQIKELGYLVKLDTNGTNPAMLEQLISFKLIDYLAMDLKGPLERYSEVVGATVDCNNLERSVKIVMSSGLPYEFRTTVVPDLLSHTDFDLMGRVIAGADKWYLQKFKSDTELVDTSYESKGSYSSLEMAELAAIGRKYVKFCEVR